MFRAQVFLFILTALFFSPAFAAYPCKTPEIRFYAHNASAPDSEKVLVEMMNHGDRFEVEVCGLAPFQQIQLRAESNHQMAFGLYRADLNGVVRSASHPSLGGTFTGIEPDGLLWSMSKPSDFESYDIRVTAEAAGIKLTRIVTRKFLPRGVQVRSLAGGLVGTFSTPTVPGRYPAIMILGGSEGGHQYPSFAANYFANQGFAAMGLAYFGDKEKKLPQHLSLIPLEYFEKAIDWLKRQSEVDAARIFVMGSSRGGELALLLGSQLSGLAGVIAIVPSGIVMPGLTNSTRGAASSWTYKGIPFPFLRFTSWSPAEFAGSNGTKYQKLTPAYEANLTDKNKVRTAEIPVEKTRAPILIIAANADQVWPSCRLSEIAWKRLKAAPRKYSDEYICFSGSGHAIVLPGFSTTETSVFYEPTQTFLVSGGNPRDTARAQREAQVKILEFLNRR